MFRLYMYGHIHIQAQHGKAQAIGGGDAVNACKLQCNIYKYAMMRDNATIYNDA